MSKSAHKKRTSAARKQPKPIEGFPLPFFIAARASNVRLVRHVDEFSLYDLLLEETLPVKEQPQTCSHGLVASDQRPSRTKKIKHLFVVSSPTVEHALFVSFLGINERGMAKERLDLAVSLLNLMEHAAGHFSGDPEDLLDSLSENLGGLILEAVDEFKGSETRIRSATARMKNALSRVESAVRQIQRYRTRPPMPQDKTKGSWTWMIQLTAKDIFRETLERPRQSEIWERLENEGWRIKGHDVVESRKKKMADAGLDRLPM